MIWLWLACSGAPTAVEQEPAPGPSAAAQAPAPAPGPAPSAAAGGGFRAAADFQLVGEASAQPRSVLIISLDTVRADRLSVYGGRASVPNLEALASQGAAFTQAMTHFPETCLSHWSMMTGVLPAVHGNAPAHGGSLYRGPTGAEIARKHGYATAAFIGGVTLTEQSCGLSRGFDLYDDQFSFNPKDMKRPGQDLSVEAARWISAQKGPYFAFVHFFDAHFPYTPAAPYDTMYNPGYSGDIDGSDEKLRPFRDGGLDPSPEELAQVLALYDGELSELDAMLHPVLSAAGKDTLVVVTADHGESFEHDYWFNHREALWDGVMHIPLLLRGPGVPTRARPSAQVGLIDLMPTLLELAGLPADRRMQGESMVGLLRGEGGGRQRVYAVTDPWMGTRRFALREEGHKVIWTEQSPAVYDLRKDPGELRPSTQVPARLGGARSEYQSALDSLVVYTAQAPAARVINDQQQAELEALGYLPPAAPAQPPPQGAAQPGGPTTQGRPPGLPPGTPPPQQRR